MILCRTFIIKHALKPHVVPSVSVKKMKRVKINTNDIIFYLDIHFYIHVLVFKLNICFTVSKRKEKAL